MITDTNHSPRNAASVILVRPIQGVPHVLMGRRPAQSAFMPDIYVFPGGAVDPDDASVNFAAELAPATAQSVAPDDPALSSTIAAAAIRELWEETGLKLARSGEWSDPPPAWRGFVDGGLVPDASSLRYIFRAITPFGRPRRFDARFFIAHADAIAGDLDAFTETTELADRHWIALTDTPRLTLAPVTAIVLMQAALYLHAANAGAPVFDATHRAAAMALGARIRQASAHLFPAPFPQGEY